MECNKDEAAKAKEIAEKKFLAKDYRGARRFALKAQNLYPGLEGIQQMVATVDVYISAENKIFGESDWYSILGVDPQADDEAVRKQYRKLALLLHPDKNKSVGADGAFKFVSEAWSLLSDKIKRALYDQKRRMAIPHAKVSNPVGSSSKQPASTGSVNVAKQKAKPKPPKSTPLRTNQSSTPSSSQKPKQKQKLNTFWTVCQLCQMQYEYLRLYINHDLVCPNCHEPFLAVEITRPHSFGSSRSSGTWSSHTATHHRATTETAPSFRVNDANISNAGPAGFSGPNASGKTSFHWTPFTGAGAASSATQAANVVQKVIEKKRERDETAGMKIEEAVKRKNVSKTAGTHSGGAKRRKTAENFTNQTVQGEQTSTSDVSGTARAYANVRPFPKREVSHIGAQNLLVDWVRDEIRHKLSEWSSRNTSSVANHNGTGIVTETNAGRKSQVTEDVSDQKKSTEDSRLPSASSGSEAAVETLQTLAINVPDPDFYNFDKDRTENCFGESQVWAAYDGKDGMPRLYAVIHNVISTNPFKIKISWLNSRTNTELGTVNWIGSGFTKTCGEFRVGKYEIYDSLNSFSHKVKWTKGARGAICIYPKKGEVWALYRNWSSDWNELTPEEVVYKYDMVEVLGDYNENEGVTVAPLVKVAGFKTVFHQHLDPKEIRTIPREEMFRFSHIVPSYLLTGQEGSNAPKGCRELDPAATSLDLLEVVVDVKDGGVLNNEGETKEEKR